MSLRSALHLERGFVRHLLRFLRVRDSDERVARGFALGMVVNFFPTFGAGVLISGFVARLFGGNAVAGLVGGATLTFFWPLLFYMNFKAGGWFVASPAPVDNVADVAAGSAEKLVWGWAFVVGSVVNAAFFGLVVYGLIRVLYGRTRPALLARGREFLRAHQVRFRRLRFPRRKARVTGRESGG